MIKENQEQKTVFYQEGSNCSTNIYHNILGLPKKNYFWAFLFDQNLPSLCQSYICDFLKHHPFFHYAVTKRDLLTAMASYDRYEAIAVRIYMLVYSWLKKLLKLI